MSFLLFLSLTLIQCLIIITLVKFTHSWTFPIVLVRLDVLGELDRFHVAYSGRVVVELLWLEVLYVLMWRNLQLWGHQWLLQFDWWLFLCFNIHLLFRIRWNPFEECYVVKIFTAFYIDLSKLFNTNKFTEKNDLTQNELALSITLKWN